MFIIKKLLGFDNPLPWVKWIRMAFAAMALLIAFLFWDSFGAMAFDGGVIGFIISLIIFLVLFAPTILVMLAISLIVCAVTALILGERKQNQSLRESAATGDAIILEMDVLRIKSRRYSMRQTVMLTVLVIVGLAVWALTSVGALPPGAYIILAAALAGVIALLRAKNPYHNQYKESFQKNVVLKGMNEVFTNVSLQPDQKFNEGLIKQSTLFSSYDSYNGKDLLSAEYHDVKFVQASVYLQATTQETYTDSEGDVQTRTEYITVFSGRLMVFDYDAISNEPVAVFPKGYKFSKAGIQSELEAFNKKFLIAAQTPTDAFRILTPPVLEGILMTSNKIGKPMRLSFVDDKLFVAIEQMDSVNLALADNASLSQLRERVAQDIQAVADIVETLYLKK